MTTQSAKPDLPPHEDAAWMRQQLNNLLRSPRICHCELSGEFHDITDGGCELCLKALDLAEGSGTA